MESKLPTTKRIDSDWLSNRDVAFLSDLVEEWLEENGSDDSDGLSFNFSIEVTWQEGSEQ